VATDIKKSEAKVVDSMSLTDVEDLCKKNDKGVVAFCRCWRRYSLTTVHLII
jgi:hypothetical protein